MGLKQIVATCVVTLLAFAGAQTSDIEIGVKRAVADEVTTPYALMRMNYVIGPQIFNSDIYAVAEAGANLSGSTQLWIAGELIVDGPRTTEFVRLEYTESGGAYLKAGVRFGFGE